MTRPLRSLPLQQRFPATFHHWRSFIILSTATQGRVASIPVNFNKDCKACRSKTCLLRAETTSKISADAQAALTLHRYEDECKKILPTHCHKYSSCVALSRLPEGGWCQQSSQCQSGPPSLPLWLVLVLYYTTCSAGNFTCFWPVQGDSPTLTPFHGRACNKPQLALFHYMVFKKYYHSC